MIQSIEKALGESQIVFFTMTIDSEEAEDAFSASNSFFTDEMKGQLNKLASGDLVTFENIISLTSEATYIDVPSLQFEVT
ncbi:MAG: hypothetical protein HRT71_15485 [Flavobacteriales bacterium]|nr:hypothetical protein [Flavobacteriales bacterium]